MTRTSVFSHVFVEHVPDHLQDATLYISIPFATVVHRCGCGCGQEVVTPLSPTDWRLTYDGESVSLHPSIGNWSFPCRSHYWIERGRVRWAPSWSQEEIEAGRATDRAGKAAYYGRTSAPVQTITGQPHRAWWRRILKRE